MGTAVFRLLFLMLAATAATGFWVAVGTPLTMVASPPSALENDKLSLHLHLADLNLERGAPVYIRIFKEESVLELWMKRQGKWVHYRDFDICKWSGTLGPKLKEGDHQSPEGFYSVSLGSLNPNSQYHLSFNIGFPNRYDRANGRSGSYLMVHGDCVSIGCYAMTNHGIETIYQLVEAALNYGQREVPVHIFPFRMIDENMQRHAGSQWIGFWQQLRPAYTVFNSSRRVPVIEVEDRRYVVRERLGKLTGL